MHTWFGDLRAGMTNDPVRHELADAARHYDWTRVLGILEKRRDCVNSSRPGGRARFTPLHQAAHGGAPEAVVGRLIAWGAWRTIRNVRGERPVDVARRRGHRDRIPRLMPVYYRHASPRALVRLERHFHAAMRQHAPRLVAPLCLPQLEPLLEMERDKVFFPVPGMYGGFVFWLEVDGDRPKLLVDAWSRIVDGDSRYEITSRSWSFVGIVDPAAETAAPQRDAEVVHSREGTESPPSSRPSPSGSSPAPGALASMRLANGKTVYVELSSAGRRRIASLNTGSVYQLSNDDVAERHRDAVGIRWMSLERLERLRRAEAPRP